MNGTRELHLRVKGVDELRVPGQPFEAYDSYCVCSYGHIRHRTRLVEDSASPKWNEEFVFDAAAVSDGSEPVVTFEVYSQGILRDELLFFAYLHLDLDTGIQSIKQQQQQQPQVTAPAAAAAAESSGCLPQQQQQQQQQHHQVRFSDGAATAAFPPSAQSAEASKCNIATTAPPAAAEDNPAAIAAAAAALRRESGSVTGARVPGASAARAAAEEAAVAASTAVFRATGSQGYGSEVAKCTVPLLPAHSSGSSSGGLLGAAAAAARSATLGRGASAHVASSKTLSKTQLKRSTHVRAAGELAVEVWWVQQPSLNNLGAPPRVLSFVRPPGVPHPLPYSSHSSLAAQWEEPPVAFVRLVVAQLSLGHAAAAAAGAVGRDGSAGAHAKAVLKQLRQLLKGDTAGAAAEEQQQQPALPSRPTLADIHGPTSLGLLMRDASGVGAAAGGLAGWDWHALELGDDLDQLQISDEEGKSGSSATSQRSSHKVSQGVTSTHPLHSLHKSGAMRSSSSAAAASGMDSADSLTESDSESCTEDLSMLDSELGIAGQQQRQGRRRLRFGRRRDEQQQRGNGSARRQVDKQLHLTVKIQLGDQQQKALRPVPLRPDGGVGIHQAAVFAVSRPLEEAAISYELGLSLGPRGQPLLGLVFQYSLLHLLRRSPARPVTWEEWRQVARCTVSGLQVPLPCLPGSSLDLSAFLADADCRAGMYAVPAVSAAAMQAAALDDAAAALAAKLAEKQAAAEAAAAAVPSRLRGELEFEALTDSGSEAGSSAADDYRVAHDQHQQHQGGSSCSSSTASRSTASSSLAGVLRRRMPGKQHLDAKEHKHQHKKGFDKLKGAAAAGMERMVDRMGEELIQAVDKLPAPVAQQVKGRFISRLFPQTRRSEVFSIGQLRVMSRPSAAALEHLKQQQHWQQQDSSQQQQQQQLLQESSVSVFAAGVPSSIAGAGTVSRDLAGILEQPGITPTNSITAFLQGRRSSQSARSSTPAAAAAAAGVAGGSGGVAPGQLEASRVVPIELHPNLATAGGPGSAPLGVLQLTLQAVNLRSRSGSSSGLQLLMRSGPHWLQLQQPALPLTFYNHKARDAGTEAASGSRVPPVQVLLPVYGSSCLVALLLHRRSHVVGRCVFKLYGLLPLLIRNHTKTLTLYSDKRGSGGQRIIAGSMLLRLAAGPPPGYSTPGAALRLAYSYLITPHTLEMHTSGVLSSISKDERDDAAGQLLTNWLAGQVQGTHALPQALVGQLVSTGRGHVSGTRMRGHVRRIKAVLLDWLPRRLDPLAFYHWRHPSHNLFVLWLLSHVCMYPSQWLFAVAIIVTLVLLRRIAIQIRRGVLGFELEQLPPDMAEAAGVPQQQQQQQSPPSDAADDVDLSHDLASLRSNAGQMGDRMRKEYKEAADKLRSALVHVKQQHKAQHPSSPTPAAFPKSLEELKDQLEAGTLNLDSLDIDAAAKQLLSVGGILKLAKHHSTSLFDYALVAQNLLDDAAGFVEGLYAMLTAQDPLAALLFCCIFLGAAGFCYLFGVGAGLYVVVCVLLRPPMLRGVPGVFGWKALLANLPSRSVEELMG